jgi:hypothetical protein
MNLRKNNFYYNLKKNDKLFFILKNLEILFKKAIDKLINYSNIESRVSKIEFLLGEIASNNNFEWEKFYLNGQYYRRKIVTELLSEINFNYIIETGTECGFSTVYFATFGKKVFSIEKSQAFFYLAKKRLKNYKNIILILNDSKNIGSILNEHKIDKEKQIFFYLDAHSEQDYPLLDELYIITSVYKNNLILIDDFQVPGDDGYGFDSFNGKKLNLNLITNSLKGNIYIYFPKISSKNETGRLRGYVLITNNNEIKKKLDSINELYLFNNQK